LPQAIAGAAYLMAQVSVQIVRFVEEHQPSIVACELVDAEGHTHTFIDKDAIFTTGYSLFAESQYPQPGWIRSEILERWQDANGEELVRISTAKPDGVEACDGRSEFIVRASQLVEHPVQA
jgi:hypothetical protein